MWLHPDVTAALIVDLQNDFCAEGGWYSTIGHDLTMGQRAALQTAKVLPALRRAGIPIIFTRNIGDPEYMSATAREKFAEKGFPLDSYCRTGSWGADFYEVEPDPADIIVVKHRFSAFRSTDLEVLLRARGTEHLLIMGVATNICVDSSARDAMMRDYRVTVVEDCCGTYDQALHDGTLENIRRAFGRVSTSGEVLSLLEHVAVA